MLRDDAALEANIFQAGFAKEVTIRDRKSSLLNSLTHWLGVTFFGSEATGPLHLRFSVGSRVGLILHEISAEVEGLRRSNKDTTREPLGPESESPSLLHELEPRPGLRSALLPPLELLLLEVMIDTTS